MKDIERRIRQILSNVGEKDKPLKLINLFKKTQKEFVDDFYAERTNRVCLNMSKKDKRLLSKMRGEE